LLPDTDDIVCENQVTSRGHNVVKELGRTDEEKRLKSMCCETCLHRLTDKNEEKSSSQILIIAKFTETSLNMGYKPGTF
jgi:hypothetical protein